MKASWAFLILLEILELAAASALLGESPPRPRCDAEAAGELIGEWRIYLGPAPRVGLRSPNRPASNTDRPTGRAVRTAIRH